VISLAVEWIIATTAAVVFAHLAIEIVGAAWLGYALLFLLPIAGGLPIGVCQWIVLRRRIDDNGLDPRIVRDRASKTPGLCPILKGIAS